MREVLPKAITDTMTEEIAYEGLRRQGVIRNLPKYVEGSYYYPDACVEEFAALDSDQLRSLVRGAITTAHYLWRTSPRAIKLVLDERAYGHLNVFASSEFAGPEVFTIWARHLTRLLRPAGVNLDQLPVVPGFEVQLSWLNELDCMFPHGLACIFFQLRREFVERKKLIGKRDLYEYARLPENEIFGFDRLVASDDPSLELERSNIHQSLYGDPFENMIFRLMRDIIFAGGGGSPIDW